MIQRMPHQDFVLLQMNHGKVNAMDIEFCDALIEELDVLAKSDATCIAFQANTHNRVFSAGIDLKRILTESTEYTRQYMPRLIRLFEKVYYFPKPTLAIVEGVAIAGGCVMAAACSRRIGTEKAAFGMPNKTLDVPIPQLAPVILNSAVATPIARQLHSETLLTAEEARDYGLLAEILPSSDLPDAINRHVLEISQTPFTPRTKSEVQFAQFATKDQEMIESWCTTELRTRVSNYINSI